MWTPIQRPNLYLDITAHVETKLEAIRQYASQLVLVPYDDGILGLNRFRGATTARFQYAEAFVQWSVSTR
jgi:LmbE family N-acetylglucosaminyl deacetylase